LALSDEMTRSALPSPLTDGLRRWRGAVCGFVDLELRVFRVPGGGGR